MILSHEEYFNRLASVIMSFDIEGRFLEIGCGGGEMLVRLPQVTTYGIDISVDQLRSTKKLGINGLCCSQAEYLPFQSEHFDFVLTHHVIEHLQDDRKAVAEIRRIVKKGGIVLVVGSVVKLLPLKLWQRLGLMRDPDHINLKPRKYWIQIFQEFGMEYRGNLQYLVKRDSPNHKGSCLLRFGIFGHLVCELISGLIRGSYIFEVR